MSYDPLEFISKVQVLFSMQKIDQFKKYISFIAHRGKITGLPQLFKYHLTNSRSFIFKIFLKTRNRRKLSQNNKVHR